MKPKDLVIVIHGHGAPAVLMEPLRLGLKRRGYEARIWSYPSFRGSINRHARNLTVMLNGLGTDYRVERFHLVGHSMGAIIVRAALAQEIPAKLGRVVLLAPPNHGSKLADFALRTFGGPLVANELSSQPGSFVNRLPVPKAEIGIIAATHDHAVTISSTHLEGETDHLVLKSFHTLPLNYKVPGLISHFLQFGKFQQATAIFKSP